MDKYYNWDLDWVASIYILAKIGKISINKLTYITYYNKCLMELYIYIPYIFRFKWKTVN